VAVSLLPAKRAALRQPGEEAEIFMKMYPGRIIKCKVDSILWATAQGQLPISGNLPNTQPMVAPEQRIAVRLLTDGKDIKTSFLATGARGQEAIYTEEHQMIQLVRRVIVRIPGEARLVRHQTPLRSLRRTLGITMKWINALRCTVLVAIASSLTLAGCAIKQPPFGAGHHA